MRSASRDPAALEAHTANAQVGAVRVAKVESKGRQNRRIRLELTTS